MREIKFRAWHNEQYSHDVMVHHGEVIDVGEEWVLGVEGEYMADSVVRYKAEIEQYTGLHDKNGVEIYEGDILAGVGPAVLVEWTKQNRRETYGHGSFGESTVSGFVFDGWAGTLENMEVIGNIHENPELLNGA